MLALFGCHYALYDVPYVRLFHMSADNIAVAVTSSSENRISFWCSVIQTAYVHSTLFTIHSYYLLPAHKLLRRRTCVWKLRNTFDGWNMTDIQNGQAMVDGSEPRRRGSGRMIWPFCVMQMQTYFNIVFCRIGISSMNTNSKNRWIADLHGGNAKERSAASKTIEHWESCSLHSTINYGLFWRYPIDVLYSVICVQIFVFAKIYDGNVGRWENAVDWPAIYYWAHSPMLFE